MKYFISIPRKSLGDIFYHSLCLNYLSKKSNSKAFLFCAKQNNWLPEYFNVQPINDYLKLFKILLKKNGVFVSLINDFIDFIITKLFFLRFPSKKLVNLEYNLGTKRSLISRFLNYYGGEYIEYNISKRLKHICTIGDLYSLRTYVRNTLLSCKSSINCQERYICIFPDAGVFQRSLKIDYNNLAEFASKKRIKVKIFTTKEIKRKSFEGIISVNLNGYDFEDILQTCNLSLYNYSADSFPSHFLSFLNPHNSIFYNDRCLSTGGFRIWCVPYSNKTYAVTPGKIVTWKNKGWEEINPQNNESASWINPAFINFF